MSSPILNKLQKLRAQTRQSTLIFAAAASAGLVLVPLAYRGQVAGTWMLAIPTLAYLILAAFRLLGGFQADRQLEFEERFVRFASSREKLLASAQGAGRLWKVSCLVQGLSRAERGAVPDAERRDYLRRSLNATSRLLLPPAVRMTVPAAVLVSVGWIVVAVSQPSSRGLYLFLAVVPTLLAIGILEWFSWSRYRTLQVTLASMLEMVADWAIGEWAPFRDLESQRPYRHRMFYLDRGPGVSARE